MRRLGRWLALVVAATAVVVPGAPASAGPPSCEVRTYSAADVIELREGKPWDIRMECWSQQAVTVTLQQAPIHGVAGTPYLDERFQEWVVPYDPADDYLGEDSLVLLASDGTESVSVGVDVRMSANRAPGCDRRNGGELYGHAVVEGVATWEIACGDPDLQDYGDLRALAQDPPAHGSVEVSAAVDSQTYDETLTVTYTPGPGFEGSDRFTAGMTDGDLIDSYEFFVNVSDGPWCQPTEPVEVRAGRTVRVLPFCTAPAWEQLTTSVPTPPEHGSTTFVGMAIDYTADPDASGSDSFTFQATGDGGPSNVVTQEVAILPNAAPVCEDRSVTTPAGSAVAVSLTCSDADGDDHELGVADQPDHGTLGELADGIVTYTPDPGWDGTDTFTYASSDYARTSEPAKVTVSVTEEQEPVVDVVVPGQSPARVARRGMRLRVTTDEAVTADLAVMISPRIARRLDIPRRIGRKQGLTVEDARRVTVPLTRAAARALRTRQRLTVFLDLAAEDEWGNGVGIEARAVLR